MLCKMEIKTVKSFKREAENNFSKNGLFLVLSIALTWHSVRLLWVSTSAWAKFARPRTATDMNGTLNTDLWKYETSRHIKKSFLHRLNIFKSCIDFQNFQNFQNDVQILFFYKVGGGKEKWNWFFLDYKSSS